jgi:hypothetical protein
LPRARWAKVMNVLNPGDYLLISMTIKKNRVKAWAA